jgi:hypothetical protein
LLRLGVVEGTAAFDFAVDQRRLQHPQRAQAHWIMLPHRSRYGSGNVVEKGHCG